VKGKACHASLPADGYNAAVGLLELLVALADGADDKLACFVRFLAKAAVGHHGDGLNINVMHPYIGRTTAQLAILNWKACGSIVGKINVRNATGLSCAEALENVKAVVGADADAQGADITLTTSDTPRDPIFVDPENHPDEIEALKRSYQDVQDRDATLLAIGGTTFAKAMPNAVCFGGIDHADGEPSLIHQNNERVKVAHYQRNINIYTLALARLLSGNSDL
jgi:succinyl-diaminopimelate desuccinylase